MYGGEKSKDLKADNHNCLNAPKHELYESMVELVDTVLNGQVRLIQVMNNIWSLLH